MKFEIEASCAQMVDTSRGRPDTWETVWYPCPVCEFDSIAGNFRFCPLCGEKVDFPWNMRKESLYNGTD